MAGSPRTRIQSRAASDRHPTRVSVTCGSTNHLQLLRYFPGRLPSARHFQSLSDPGGTRHVSHSRDLPDFLVFSNLEDYLERLSHMIRTFAYRFRLPNTPRRFRPIDPCSFAGIRLM